MLQEQVDAENMGSDADGRIDKRAGEQPDGQVETLWWPQPALPNDRVSQTENTGGRGKTKENVAATVSSPPLSLAFTFIFLPFTSKLLWHLLGLFSYPLLLSLSLSLSPAASCSSLSSYLSGQEAGRRRDDEERRSDPYGRRDP